MNITDPREQRGLLIAAMVRLVPGPDGVWQVPSQSRDSKYAVRLGPGRPTCSCPDHQEVGCKCKHIFAVECVIRREGDHPGMVVSTVTIHPPKTYPQNWAAYNRAQTVEKRAFQRLLHDLCRSVQEPPHGKGRPKGLLSDAIFTAAFKVYSTFSGRRFMSDLEDAHAKGFISKLPHFNTIFAHLDSVAVGAVLPDLIVRSALPLHAIEQDFAVDSTGFTVSRFARWYDLKYGAPRKEKDWVKLHLICGVKTNVVTAAEIRDKHANDNPIFPGLVKATAENFRIREVSADKAYGGQRNLATVVALGGQPFIPFKSNERGAGGGLHAKLYHSFKANEEEFLAHYHKRSNVESTVAMIKAKFRDHVRSRTREAMKNEVLCKVLCHNICCLIGAIYELGIEPKFDQLCFGQK